VHIDFQRQLIFIPAIAERLVKALVADDDVSCEGVVDVTPSLQIMDDKTETSLIPANRKVYDWHSATGALCGSLPHSQQSSRRSRLSWCNGRTSDDVRAYSVRI